MKPTIIALLTAFALSGTAALAATQPGATFGNSGTSVGTVTAPSVGSYYWPSVGTTNSVPTYSNTMPSGRSAPSASFGGKAPF